MNKTSPRRAIGFLACLAIPLLTACDILGINIGSQMEIGRVDFRDTPHNVVVPEAVRAGTEFAVSVTTVGNGCRSVGRTEVKVQETAAIITPFDRVSGDKYCTSVGLQFEHSARLTFGQRGPVEVRFRVIDRADGQERIISRTVQIQ